MFPALEQVSPAAFRRPTRGTRAPRRAPGCCAPPCGSASGPAPGPFRSLARLAVEPRAYQLVPLLMALRQDTVRLLIADDVGIGKTIEAGLVAAELLEQGDATGLAVLCGPALAEQWQQELATKFGIHAELVLPGTIRRLERGLLQGETLFDRYRHIVVSTDFIKRPGLREQFWHGCPDLLIIDEAHTCVSDGTGGRSRMLRHELVTGLASDASPAPDPGHRHPAQRQGRGVPQPAGPARARTWPTSTWNRSQGRERLARYFVQRRRADIRSYLGRGDAVPGGPAEPGTALHAVPGVQGAVRRRARVRPRDRPGSRRRPAPAAGPVLVGAGAAAGAGLLAAGRRRHAAHPGREPRRRGRRPKPTSSAAPPSSTCPTRRPSSPPMPPPARTARPPRATPRSAGGCKRFAGRAAELEGGRRPQARRCWPRSSPSCCSTGSTRSCSAASSTPPNTSPSTWPPRLGHEYAVAAVTGDAAARRARWRASGT